MKIISISGLDGSGKSTQVKLLKNYLASKNKKLFYFHSVDFSISNKIFFWKHKKNKRSDYGVTKSSWLNIQLRKIALLIDSWRFKRLIKKLKKQHYDYLLSDRYFYDNLVNLAFLKTQSSPHQNVFNISFIIPKLFQNLSLIVNPDISIYLKILPEIILHRDRIPNQGLNYLKEKEKFYTLISQYWTMQIIDGNQKKEEVFENIKTLLALEEKKI